MIFKFSPRSDILIAFMTRWIILYLWVWVLFNICSKFLLIISVVFDLPYQNVHFLWTRNLSSYSLLDPQGLVGKL